MKKCPYCCEVVQTEINRCPHCTQFFLDALIESDFKSVDKISCIFCGKRIFAEARVCKYCHKWIDEVNRDVEKIS